MHHTIVARSKSFRTKGRKQLVHLAAQIQTLAVFEVGSLRRIDVLAEPTSLFRAVSNLCFRVALYHRFFAEKRF